MPIIIIWRHWLDIKNYSENLRACYFYSDLKLKAQVVVLRYQRDKNQQPRLTGARHTFEKTFFINKAGLLFTVRQAS